MENGAELQSIPTKNGGTIKVESQTTSNNDDLELIRLGKKPILKRTFGFMSILGFACTVLITWEGILITSTQSFLNGGPAGVIWGFLIVWLGTLSTFAVIAELSSMAPTAGGQYHWVAMLAPDNSRKFSSYITGWMTFAGWQAVTASAAYLIGTLIQGLIILTNSNYAPAPWQAMLLFWAVLVFAVFINTVASKALAAFEGLILVLHLFGFLAVLIPLVYLGPHGDTSIFYSFINYGNWPTAGLSFMVGLPGAVFSLFGADSAVHMSEEIKHASIVVPRALMLAILINGTLGFAMVLAFMFCLGDPNAALSAASTLGYPFLEVFQQAVSSNVGAALMGALICTLGICSTVGCLAASSRMLWSFSRDRGVPFWQHLSKLDRRTSIPVWTVTVTTVVSVLLSFIILGSAVAFNDIVSLSIAGLYSSYLIVCALLLWRRLTGAVKPHNNSVTMIGPGRLYWGVWRIPGVLGTANNIVACMYLVLLIFWSFWPPATPVTPSTMNFAVLIWGSIVIFAVGWYFAVARKTYKGPVVEVQLEDYQI